MQRAFWTSVGGAAALLAAVGAFSARAQMQAPPVQRTDPAPEGRRIAEDGLIANYFPPPAGKPAPGILLLGGSEGALGAGSANIARALQASGFAVLQLSYFRAPGQSPKLALVPLESFDAGLAWLKRQAGVNQGELAVVGGSKGAEAALLVAVRHPELKAVVAGMPSSVVWPGIDWDGLETRSSWSSRGEPLPDLAYGAFSPQGGPLSVYQNGLAALPAHPDAAIPIERSSAQVLLVCGEADALWPSCPMARQLQDRDQAKVTVLSYADAGHGVFGVPLAQGDPRTAGLAVLGGTPGGNNAARSEGWPKVLAFLHRALEARR